MPVFRCTVGGARTKAEATTLCASDLVVFSTSDVVAAAKAVPDAAAAAVIDVLPTVFVAAVDAISSVPKAGEEEEDIVLGTGVDSASLDLVRLSLMVARWWPIIAKIPLGLPGRCELIYVPFHDDDRSSVLHFLLCLRSLEGKPLARVCRCQGDAARLLFLTRGVLVFLKCSTRTTTGKSSERTACRIFLHCGI